MAEPMEVEEEAPPVFGALARCFVGVHECYVASAPPETVSVEEDRGDPWASHSGPVTEPRVFSFAYTFAARRVVIVPSFGRYRGEAVEFESRFRSLRRRRGTAWTVLDAGRAVFEPGEGGDARLVACCERTLFQAADYLGDRASFRRGARLPTPGDFSGRLPADVAALALRFAGFERTLVRLRPAVGGFGEVAVLVPRLPPRQLVAVAVAALAGAGADAAAVEALARSSHSCVFGFDPARDAASTTVLWDAGDDQVIVRDAATDAYAAFADGDFEASWAADPGRALGLAIAPERCFVHATRPFDPAARNLGGAGSTGWLVGPRRRNLLTWHPDEDRLGTRVWRGDLGPPELRSAACCRGRGPLLVTAFPLSGGPLLETTLRETTDGNAVGGTVHSLVVDAAWRDDVVKSAILCDDGSLGTPLSRARLAKVDDVNCAVAFGAAARLLPGCAGGQVAPLGLSLSYLSPG